MAGHKEMKDAAKARSGTAKKRAKEAKASADRARTKADRARTKADRANDRFKERGSRTTGSAIREAIKTALGQDTELAEEMEDAQRRAGGSRGAGLLLHAADALEPVLADAVERKPSFLGRLAYGTAQLVSALATDDEASSKRLAEIAGADHVGIVFIDVVGFTAYTAENGDDAAVALVTRLETLVGSICNLHDGEVVKHLGDGFLLAFRSAADAVRAGIALRDAARRKRSVDPAFQPVRIAVHAGRPSVVQEDLIGHDVNLTARVLTHCDPGEVLVTADAKQLAEKDDDSLGFDGGRRVEARGIPEPIEVLRAV